MTPTEPTEAWSQKFAIFWTKIFCESFIKLEMSKKSKKSPKIDQKHEKFELQR